MASVAIVGSGFVGEATGKALAQFGHTVNFFDTNPEKVGVLLQEGYRAFPVKKLGEETADVFFIAVPTPTDESGIRLDSIQEAAKMIGLSALRQLSHYPIVVTKSTIPPGTTRQVITPLLEEYSGKKAGRDFGVAFEPEYLRQRVSLSDARAPRLILVGTEDSRAFSFLEWLRAPFQRPVKRVTAEAAEFQKYVHNLFNATKVSFFNEMREVGRSLGLDPEEVFEVTARTAEASWNPKYGIRDFGPYDGTCLPKDTRGFLRFAQEKLQAEMPLLEAIIKVNERLEAKLREEGEETTLPDPLLLSLPVVQPDPREGDQNV